MPPKISIVIPAYNRANVIGRAIKSVLLQTYDNFEIIVVDDGSTDNTKDIVESFADDRISYVCQKNSGAPVARNTGLKIAKGKYIAFLDSDDEWLPTFLEAALQKFNSDSDISCVYCLTGKIFDNQICLERDDYLEGYIYKEALEQGFITSPTFLICKKSCFDKIGEWDISLKCCQDDDICFRLAKYFKFGLVKEIQAVYHTDGGGQICSSASRLADGWLVLWEKYENEILVHCGKKVLAKHLDACFKRFRTLRNKDKIRYLSLKILKLEFTPKHLYNYLRSSILGR